eukprot:1127724-Prorocentrum_lima.AAC.1
MFVDGSVLVEHCLAVPKFSPGNPDVHGDGNQCVDVGGLGDAGVVFSSSVSSELDLGATEISVDAALVGCQQEISDDAAFVGFSNQQANEEIS